MFGRSINEKVWPSASRGKHLNYSACEGFRLASRPPHLCACSLFWVEVPCALSFESAPILDRFADTPPRPSSTLRDDASVGNWGDRIDQTRARKPREVAVGLAGRKLSHFAVPSGTGSSRSPFGVCSPRPNRPNRSTKSEMRPTVSARAGRGSTHQNHLIQRNQFCRQFCLMRQCSEADGRRVGARWRLGSQGVLIQSLEAGLSGVTAFCVSRQLRIAGPVSSAYCVRRVV